MRRDLREIIGGLMLLLAFGVAAGADVRIESTKDGRLEEVLPQPPDANPPSARYNGVPYLTTPDWSNDVRRQVAAVTPGDLNNDGKIDLAVGCFISNSFPPYTDWENLIYFNTGNALEATASWVSADEVHTSELIIAKINNDAYPDLVSVNGGTSFSPSVIYFGGPTGPSNSPGWTATPPQATWATAGVVFDFDHDGDLDLFTTNQGLSPNPYRPQQGFRNNNGVLETTPFWQSTESAIRNGLAFADYDGNGWEDLAIAGWVNFETGISLNTGGSLATAPTWTSGVTSGDRGVAWSDVDGNGWPDLAVGRSPMILYSNTAGTLTQTWTAAPPFASQPQDMRFFDVDRDGDDDLAEIQFSTGRVHIYLNTNGTLATTPSWTYDDPGAGNAINFGDINGDGWADLIVGTSGQPSVKVFYARIPNVLGDMNCDGQVNALDVPLFVTALVDADAYSAAYPMCNINRGDMNASTLVDGDDVQGFSAAVIGP